jgi:hypothetical protein
MQTHEKTTKSRGRQVLVKPSANPLLKDYEHAQDVAGEFFAPLGLVRGKTRKRNRQEAKEAGLPLPGSVRHTSPRAFREARLAAVRKAEDKARGLLAEAAATSEKAEGHRTAALQEAAGIREAAQTDAKRIEADAEAGRHAGSAASPSCRTATGRRVRARGVSRRVGRTQRQRRLRDGAEGAGRDDECPVEAYAHRDT